MQRRDIFGRPIAAKKKDERQKDEKAKSKRRDIFGQPMNDKKEAQGESWAHKVHKALDNGAQAKLAQKQKQASQEKAHKAQAKQEAKERKAQAKIEAKAAAAQKRKNEAIARKRKEQSRIEAQEQKKEQKEKIALAEKELREAEKTLKREKKERHANAKRGLGSKFVPIDHYHRKAIEARESLATLKAGGDPVADKHRKLESELAEIKELYALIVGEPYLFLDKDTFYLTENPHLYRLKGIRKGEEILTKNLEFSEFEQVFRASDKENLRRYDPAKYSDTNIDNFILLLKTG